MVPGLVAGVGVGAALESSTLILLKGESGHVFGTTKHFPHFTINRNILGGANLMCFKNQKPFRTGQLIYCFISSCENLSKMYFFLLESFWPNYQYHLGFQISVI